MEQGQLPIKTVGESEKEFPLYGTFKKPDGGILFGIDRDTNTIREYKVSEFRDTSAVRYTGNSISTYDDDPSSIYWKPDGTRFWVLHTGSKVLHQWDVDTPWDVTSAHRGNSLSVATTDPIGMFWEDDGKFLWIVNNDVTSTYVLRVSDSWNIDPPLFLEDKELTEKHTMIELTAMLSSKV